MKWQAVPRLWNCHTESEFSELQAVVKSSARDSETGHKRTDMYDGALSGN